MHLKQTAFEHSVVVGETDHKEQFILLPQCVLNDQTFIYRDYRDTIYIVYSQREEFSKVNGIVTGTFV